VRLVDEKDLSTEAFPSRAVGYKVISILSNIFLLTRLTCEASFRESFSPVLGDVGGANGVTGGE
jgi:hypothetical protein